MKFILKEYSLKHLICKYMQRHVKYGYLIRLQEQPTMSSSKLHQALIRSNKMYE